MCKVSLFVRIWMRWILGASKLPLSQWWNVIVYKENAITFTEKNGSSLLVIILVQLLGGLCVRFHHSFNFLVCMLSFSKIKATHGCKYFYISVMLSFSHLIARNKLQWDSTHITNLSPVSQTALFQDGWVCWVALHIDWQFRQTDQNNVISNDKKWTWFLFAWRLINVLFDITD